jgi:hypothetical protein
VLPSHLHACLLASAGNLYATANGEVVALSLPGVLSPCFSLPYDAAVGFPFAASAAPPDAAPNAEPVVGEALPAAPSEVPPSLHADSESCCEGLPSAPPHACCTFSNSNGRLVQRTLFRAKSKGYNGPIWHAK